MNGVLGLSHTQSLKFGSIVTTSNSYYTLIRVINSKHGFGSSEKKCTVWLYHPAHFLND